MEHKHNRAEEISKYDEALALYDTNLDDNAIHQTVTALLDDKRARNDTVEVKKVLFG